MPINVVCPACTAQLRVADDQAGRTITCPNCQASVALPAPRRTAPQGPKKFPHFIHVVLCVFTCGFWLPIYGLHYCVRGASGGSVLTLMLFGSIVGNILLCGGFILLSATHSWYLFPWSGGGDSNANSFTDLFKGGK